MDALQGSTSLENTLQAGVGCSLLRLNYASNNSEASLFKRAGASITRLRTLSMKPFSNVQHRKHLTSLSVSTEFGAQHRHKHL